MSKVGPSASLLNRLPRVRGKLKRNVSLSRYTWFRVGGPADILFVPADDRDLIESVTIIRKGAAAEAFNAAKIFESEQQKLITAEQEEAAAFQKEMDLLEQQATETSSGLKYLITQEGGGEKPQLGQIVVVHYSGYLMNGKKFDSSIDRNKPFEFPLGQKRVILGWDEGIGLLNIGSKAKLLIPPHLGYGARGAGGGVIPPNARLLFEVELINAYDSYNHDHSDPNHRH